MSDKSPERIAMEAEAEKLQVSFPANIGDDKLQAKIDEAKAALGQSAPKTPPKEDGTGKTSGQKKRAKTKEPEPETDVFEVIDRLRHNGTLYKPGDPIELDVNKELPGLVTAGVIADPNEE